MSAKLIERGRFRFHRVTAGKYIVERRARTRWYYAGLVSRVRPNIEKKATCWQISGPAIGITRYGYGTLGSAIFAFTIEA